MLAGVVQQPDDVMVVERVEREAPGPADPHEPRGAQEAQLVRNGRLGLTDERGQVADAALSMGQRIDESDAGGIPQQFEDVGQRLDGAPAQETRADVR